MIKCTGNHWVSKWICTQIKLGRRGQSFPERLEQILEAGVGKVLKKWGDRGGADMRVRLWSSIDHRRMWKWQPLISRLLSTTQRNARNLPWAVFKLVLSSTTESLWSWGEIATLFSVLSPWFCELASRYRRHRESNNSRVELCRFLPILYFFQNNPILRTAKLWCTSSLDTRFSISYFTE